MIVKLVDRTRLLKGGNLTGEWGPWYLHAREIMLN